MLGTRRLSYAHRHERESNEPPSRKHYVPPWKCQNLHRASSGWIGVTDCVTPTSIPLRSAWGGIVDGDAWEALYTAHAVQGGHLDSIGSWLPSAVARRQVEVAMTHATSQAPPVSQPCDATEASVTLVGADLERFTVFDHSSATWLPTAGCTTRFAREHGIPQMDEPYNPGLAFGECLLPLVFKERKMVRKDAEALDATVVQYLAQGALIPWTREHGYPTVVSQPHVVWQDSTSLDSSGNLQTVSKPRVAIDFRYVNGAVPSKGIVLPSVEDIAIRTEIGDKVARQDVKSGYHQIEMVASDRHLATIIWKGELYAFTCMTFGLRDAPEYLQSLTQYVSSSVQAIPGVRFADSYIDDFIQVGSALDDEAIKQSIVSHGLILGASKCLPAHAVQEVLGLEIHVEKRKIFAPKRKIQYVRDAIRCMLGGTRVTTTLELAVLLGKMASLEPAVPNLLLLSRPIYADLSSALCSVDSIVERRPLPPIENSSTARDVYRWKIVPVQLSDLGREALSFITKSIEKRNGLQFDLSGTQPKFLIAQDASEEGFGGTLRRFESGSDLAQSPTCAVSIEAALALAPEWETQGALPDEVVGDSSMAREATGLCCTVQAIPVRILQGSVFVAVVDNRGLAQRHRVGSSASDRANAALIRLVKYLARFNAMIKEIFWVPRARLQKEDSLSRVYQPMVYSVDKAWFSHTLPLIIAPAQPPNVDAFADRDTALLPRFAAIDGSGPLFDGVRVKWERTDIPWFFPPLPLAARALKNWIGSDSTESVWCIPERADTLVTHILTTPQTIKKKLNRCAAPMRLPQPHSVALAIITLEK